jgi:hypothetical protein
MRSLLLLALALPSLAAAQGEVLPTTAPGPTMLTLNEVAPRTLVGTLAGLDIVIYQPGSYVLAGDFHVFNNTAISITCDDVTLDLNGFTVSSYANPAAGVAIDIATGRKNITIRNGRIRGGTTITGGVFTTTTGFLYGISGLQLTGVLVEDVTVTGVPEIGINLPGSQNGSAVVNRCGVDTCATVGIVAGRILDSSATHCPVGLRADQIVDSFADSLGGIAIDGANVTGCYAFSEGAAGIEAEIASACFAESRTKVGLNAEVATACYGKTYSGTTAIQVGGTASFCFGYHPNLPAIAGRHALGCSANGTITTTYKDHSE